MTHYYHNDQLVNSVIYDNHVNDVLIEEGWHIVRNQREYNMYGEKKNTIWFKYTTGMMLGCVPQKEQECTTTEHGRGLVLDADKRHLI